MIRCCHLFNVNSRSKHRELHNKCWGVNLLPEVCFGMHFYALGVWLTAGRLKGGLVLLVVVSVTGQVCTTHSGAQLQLTSLPLTVTLAYQCISEIFPHWGGAQRGDSETMQDYDDTVAFLGQWGRFQQVIFFLLCVSMVPNGIVSFCSVFLADTPSHYCLIPEVNLTQDWQNATIPTEVRQPGLIFCQVVFLLLKLKCLALKMPERTSVCPLLCLTCYCVCNKLFNTVI